MKVLAPTYVFPDKHHIRTRAFNNIFSSLKSKIDLEVVWVVFQPDKFSPTGSQYGLLNDIHDFDDAISLLKKIRPDCILVTSSVDVIQYALCIAAKHLQIPIFAIYINNQTFMNTEEKLSAVSSIRKAIAIFSSNKITTDTASDQKSFRRGKFIMYKNKFLFNTLRNTGKSFINSIAAVNDHMLNASIGKSKNYNKLSDYHILTDDYWLPILTAIGIDSKSIFVTGNPYWENILGMNKPPTTKNSSSDSSNLLIVTDSLVEHGYWSEKQRNSFLKDLVSNLQKSNLKVSFKIHPSSEDIEAYKKLFIDSDQIQIFQSESISDILSNIDVVISYGNTTAQTEIIANNIKLILIDLKMKLKQSPLIKEGISCGLVTVLESTERIAEVVHECLDKKVVMSNELMAKRDVIFSKNGQPSEKIADIMIKMIYKQ